MPCRAPTSSVPSPAFAVLAMALASVIAAALPVAAQAPAADDEVRIYRCTGADGRVSIGNLPCASGDAQQVRGMLRPVDGAPPRPAPATLPAPAVAPEVRTVVVREAQPLYECVTPDGQRYDSDDGEGSPRWVPLWTLGYPSGPVGRPPPSSNPPRSGAPPLMVPGAAGISAPRTAGISAPIPGRGARPPSEIGRRPPPPGGPAHPRQDWRDDYGGGGTWVRDDCRPLPRAEACARLDDRLDDLRGRFFNAQQRERDVLRVEERGLVARLDEDCRR